MTDVTVRTEIVRICRLMNARGLNQGASGNLSVRAPGGMLITPSAVPYESLRPDQIVRMSLDGTVLDGDGRPSTEWRLHAAILRARTGANAILHAHPMFCTTLACLHREIPAFHYMVAVAGGDSIRCAPYATFGTADLAARVVEALDGRQACLLANHGMVAIADSPPDALELATEIETLAAQYWRALQVGEPVLLSDAEMAEVLAAFRDYRSPGAAEPPPAHTAPGRAAPAGNATAAAGPIDWAAVGQRWIGRVGALLLLVGLAYLMKFAADQGWFGPSLRIGFGVATGIALLVAGLRLDAGKRPYALTLLGTGVATLYLTGYAAYALYGFLGPTAAFLALTATTALALGLARRRKEQILAQIGAAGAFAAPLLLGELGGPVALSLYVVGVAGWTGLLAFRHGWRSLLLTTLAGAFGLLAVGATRAPADDALALSLAGVWSWAVVAILPLVRERIDPVRIGWGRKPVPALLTGLFPRPAAADHTTAAVLIVLATTLLVALMAQVWELGRGGAAGLGFAATGVLGAMIVDVSGRGAGRALVVGAAPALLAYLGSALLLPDDAARVTLLAVGGTAAFLVPRFRSAPGVDVLGHALFALLASWISAQVSDGGRPTGFAAPLAAAELLAIIAAVVVALRSLDSSARRVYLVAAHVAVLIWVVICARGIDGGLAWVSVLWGAYGAGLLVLAIARNLAGMRLAALGTLGLVAVKLLLIDTAGVGAAWRIVLFLGFGAAFLALGYLSSTDETGPEAG